tara:strand:+ start:966 stop:1457 length:492 start_codon:yes stop_codon:yes gene_type:complete
MSRKIINKYLFLILIINSLILISAFIIEYKFGHQPCNLCIYQRIPYLLSILLIPLFLFSKNKVNFGKKVLLVLVLIFFFSATLAFYHFGIEQGFFKESLVCDVKNISENLSKEEIAEQLKLTSISCKNVSFRILGLSLAAINFITSLILLTVFIKLFLNYKKF